MLPRQATGPQPPSSPPVRIGIDTSRYGHYAAFLRDDQQPAAPELQFAESADGYAQFRQEEKRGRESFRSTWKRLQTSFLSLFSLFVWKHRFFIVKRTAKLTEGERDDLEQLFADLPELRPLWSFSQDIYRLLDNSRTLRVARWRYTWLRYDPKYEGVRELVEALELLADPKLTKAMAFLGQPAGSQVRTNNHVERLNRRLRFAEKVRYRWRKRKWVVRWVVLLLDGCWQQAAEAAAAAKGAKPSGERAPPQPSARGKKKVA